MMSVLISVLALIFSIGAILYLIWLIRINRKYLKKTNENKVVISGPRKRIEDKIYSLNELYFSEIEHLYDSTNLFLEIPERDLTIKGLTPNFSFFEDYGFNMDKISIKEKTAFCIMPFHKKFDTTYATIKNACQAAGYTCLRSDEPFCPGNVLRQILDMMLSSEVVIALLDGRNANVFYEIGIAHSIGKTVILLGSLGKEEAFDFKLQRTILYSSQNDLRSKLVKCLNHIHYA